MKPVARLLIVAAVIFGSASAAFAWMQQGGSHHWGPRHSGPQQFQAPPQSFRHPWHGPHHHGSHVWYFGSPAYPYRYYPYRYYSPAYPYAYPYPYLYSYPYSSFYYGSYGGSYMNSFGSPYVGAPLSSGGEEAYADESGGGEPPATRAADGSWFYCRALREYYPDVKRCPEAWLQVPPTPPTR
jgi:hypothetical protein